MRTCRAADELPHAWVLEGPLFGAGAQGGEKVGRVRGAGKVTPPDLMGALMTELLGDGRS
jgi:hypothetical protein